MTSAQASSTPFRSAPTPIGEDARAAAAEALDVGQLMAIDGLQTAVDLIQRALVQAHAGIAIVTAERVHVVAHSNGQTGPVPRSDHLAAFAVADTGSIADEVVVLANTLGTDRLAGHPQVVGGLRFFAAAPIADDAGHRLGAVFVDGPVADTLTYEDRRLLVDTARLVERLLWAETSTAMVSQLDQQVLDSARLAELGSLSAGIAHEINTPSQFVSDNLLFLGEMASPLITAVQDFVVGVAEVDTVEERAAVTVELVRRLDDLDFEFAREEVPAAIAQSQDGVEQIRRIVRSLRDYSHPGSADFQYADLNTAIESTSVVCRSRWKEHATLEFRLDAELPEVPCHLGEVNQVIMNLIVNAADAIAETGPTLGTVTVSTAVEAGFAVISVSDDGAGIPEHVQGRIFDQFFTTKDVGCGTGQGLPISRAVAEAHHGSLQFETTPGVGTTFMLRLPLEVDTPEAGVLD